MRVHHCSIQLTLNAVSVPPRRRRGARNVHLLTADVMPVPMYYLYRQTPSLSWCPFTCKSIQLHLVLHIHVHATLSKDWMQICAAAGLRKDRNRIRRQRTVPVLAWVSLVSFMSQRRTTVVICREGGLVPAQGYVCFRALLSGSCSKSTRGLTCNQQTTVCSSAEAQVGLSTNSPQSLPRCRHHPLYALEVRACRPPARSLVCDLAVAEEARCLALSALVESLLRALDSCWSSRFEHDCA